MWLEPHHGVGSEEGERLVVWVGSAEVQPARRHTHMHAAAHMHGIGHSKLLLVVVEVTVVAVGGGHSARRQRQQQVDVLVGHGFGQESVPVAYSHMWFRQHKATAHSAAAGTMGGVCKLRCDTARKGHCHKQCKEAFTQPARQVGRLWPGCRHDGSKSRH